MVTPRPAQINLQYHHKGLRYVVDFMHTVYPLISTPGAN